jgi:hypothetical protein
MDGKKIIEKRKIVVGVFFKRKETKIIKNVNWGWLNPCHVDNSGSPPDFSLAPIITRFFILSRG